MNERDSEAMAAQLVAAGHTLAVSEDAADAVIFNTCSVRDQSERKAVGKAGFLKKLKSQHPQMKIGIVGCMAENRGGELLAELPHLDFVVGCGQLHRVKDALTMAVAGERPLLTGWEQDGKTSGVLESMGEHCTDMRRHPFMASIAITRGCNRFCSYCIVPYVRGREVSRSAESIIREAEALADSGVKELLLLGQNVAAWGLNGIVTPPPDNVSPFGELIRKLGAIKGIERIRFTSPYPTYFNSALIDALASTPAVCPAFHLPLQSGSEKILRAMNRQYTPEIYRNIVARIKKAIPDAVFSTDVIVGFPGETAEDFAATRDMMNETGFIQAFIFKYSTRPGTKSSLLTDDVTDEVKLERNNLLLADLEERSLRANAALIGSEQQVLIEGVSPRNPQRWSGKTVHGRTVIFFPEKDWKPGDIKPVEIGDASAMSLFAKGVRENN